MVYSNIADPPAYKQMALSAACRGLDTAYYQNTIIVWDCSLKGGLACQNTNCWAIMFEIPDVLQVYSLSVFTHNIKTDE